MEDDNQLGKQKIRRYSWPKGVSGNPKGRPKGKTLKEFARGYLESLDDTEKLKFLECLPEDVVWQMAEGRPDTKTETKVVIKSTFTPEELENAKHFIINKLGGSAGTIGPSLRDSSAE